MADVVALPTAASAPVLQTRRAGRYPNEVASLSAVRRARSIAELDEKATSKRQTIDALEWMLEEARRGALPHMVAFFEHNGGEFAMTTGRFKADLNLTTHALERAARIFAGVAGG